MAAPKPKRRASAQKQKPKQAEQKPPAAAKKNGATEAFQAQNINLAQAAELVDKSGRWVQLRAKDGYIQTAGRGKYPLVAFVRGVVRYYEDLTEKSSKATAASDASRARTKLAEIQAAQKLRELIPVDEASGIITEMMGAVLGQLNGLPARITRDLALRQVIDAEIGDAIDRIREHAERAGRDLSGD